MKRKLFLLLLAIILPLYGWAEVGDEFWSNTGELALKYKITKEIDGDAKGECVIVGTKASDDNWNGILAIYTLIYNPNKSDYNEYSVTGIEGGAFDDCTGLTNLIIPDGIDLIPTGDKSVFQDCENLQYVSLECKTVGKNWFKNTKIEQVNLSNEVTTIEDNAFADCDNLQELTIGGNVTTIGDNAFEGCNSLSKISFSCSTVKNWFQGMESIQEVFIGGNCSSIANEAFLNCSGLKEIGIGGLESITIGDRAFYGCGLSKLNIYNDITSVGNEAFGGDNSLFTVSFYCSQVRDWFSGLKNIQGASFDNKVETIVEGAFQGCSNLEHIYLYGQHNIGAKAFYGCGVRDLSIPKNIGTIGENAFGECNSLTTIDFECPKVGTWFKGMNSIQELKFFDDVEEIEAGAFEGCSSLKYISFFGDKVTTIGENVFKGCALSKFKIPNSITDIATTAFSECNSLSELFFDCTNVGAWFQGMKNIQEVYFNSTVETIADEAFKNCSGLNSIVFDYSYSGNSNITKIGQDAFNGCALTDVDIPSKVETIGKGAFDNNQILTVGIYSSKTGDVFAGFKSLNYLYIGDETTEISDGAFEKCSHLSSMDCGKNIKTIGARAFAETSLNKITIPESVITIGESAFAKTPLSTVTIPESVTTIGTKAFAETSLTDIVIPASVTTIGASVFSNTVLGTFQVLAEEPITDISADAFLDTDISNCILRVPVGSKEKYQEADVWKDFEFKYVLEVGEDIPGAFEAAMENLNNTINEATEYYNKIKNNSDLAKFAEELKASIDDATEKADNASNSAVISELQQQLSNSLWMCQYQVDDRMTANRVAFQNYITEQLTAIDELAEEDDSEECEKLIAEAKSAIEEMKMDESISLADNKAEVDKIVAKLKSDLKSARSNDMIQDITVVTEDGQKIESEVTIEIDEEKQEVTVTAVSVPESEGDEETEGVVAIPAVITIDGEEYPVTEIADNAFAGKTDITDIYLPETEEPIKLGTDALKIDDENIANIHTPLALLDDYALNKELEENFKAGKVSAVVTAPNKYWTFSCGVDVVVPEGVSVYTCQLNEDGTAVVKTQIPEEKLLVGSKRIIKANNGVLVASTDGSDSNAYEIVANPGGQASGTTPATTDLKSYGEDNLLEPVIVSKNYAAGDYYVLYDNEFHYILDNTSRVPACKAVLKKPAGVAASRSLGITGNDGATGISRIEADDESAEWYNLSGQRINRPAVKGVFVKNGKKVVIK